MHLNSLTRRHEGTKRPVDPALEHIAASVIDTAFQLHREFGPGLLEGAYELVLFEELRRAGLDAARQVSLPLKYRDLVIDHAFKIDLLIEGKLIVELKSVERLLPVHGKQVVTYLRLTKLPLGLLINFGEALFKNGVKRILNDYQGPFGSR